MEAELKKGDIVRLLTTQYTWKYDANLNTHSYRKFPPGTECIFRHIWVDNVDRTRVAKLFVLECDTLLNVSPNVIEKA